MSTRRITLSHAARTGYRAIDALDAGTVFEPRPHELVRTRASRINGCAFCVEVHSVGAQAAGGDELGNPLGVIIAINAGNRVGVATALHPAPVTA